MGTITSLSDDILLEIFTLCEVKDKKKLCEVNKFFYELLTPKLQKYKLITFLNQDYLQFYKFLNEYDYSGDITYMEKVIVRSFMTIPTVWASHICGMYDLRFIFELMYKGYDIKTEDIKIYNLHFYIHFYSRIKKCIANTRKETLSNIDKCAYLFSLRKNPKFRKTSKNGPEFEWVSLVE